MEGERKPLWRRPLAIALYVIAVFIGLFALTARDRWQGADQQRAVEVPPPFATARPGTALAFRNASFVAGTGIMRVNLVRPVIGFEYSSYSEVRNILFLDPGAQAGRWLLPDADHVMAESLDIRRENAPGVQTLLAVAALVKPPGGDLLVVDGQLIVFDPTGRVVETLSEGVRKLHVAAVGQGSEYVVMYERQRKFVAAILDPQTLKRRSEQVFEIPRLR